MMRRLALVAGVLCLLLIPAAAQAQSITAQLRAGMHGAGAHSVTAKEGPGGLRRVELTPFDFIA